MLSLIGLCSPGCASLTSGYFDAPCGSELRRRRDRILGRLGELMIHGCSGEKPPDPGSYWAALTHSSPNFLQGAFSPQSYFSGVGGCDFDMFRM